MYNTKLLGKFAHLIKNIKQSVYSVGIHISPMVASLAKIRLLMSELIIRYFWQGVRMHLLFILCVDYIIIHVSNNINIRVTNSLVFSLQLGSVALFCSGIVTRTHSNSDFVVMFLVRTPNSRRMRKENLRRNIRRVIRDWTILSMV